AGVRDGGNEVAAHGIGHAYEYDRDAARLAQQRAGSGRRIANKDIGVQCDQLLGEQLRLVGARRREAIVDADAAAFLPAHLLKCLSERGQARLCFRIIFGVADEHSDAANLCRLLRTCREWPRRRTAEKSDELAASHSITSSARASSVGGISRPSAFAVLRLITSSSLVGFCTGRSAGFSPLRMRST